MSVPGSIVLDEVTSGAVLVALMELLKQWFPSLHAWILRAISILWSVVSVFIISIEWGGGGGGNTLVLTLPTAAQTVMILFHVLEQFSVNEILYRTVVPKKAAK